jgi:Icc-related predicted phosphoesterase
MNNHLLPFPYNQSQPSTWLDRVIHFIFSLLARPSHSTPQQPSATPIDFHSQDGLPPIRIICISDTHNATHLLPPGDILIHAGDLTARGTFVEIQAQLQWLSSQSHAHKIVIAGNHDILLDETRDTKLIACSADSVAERNELNWAGIHYLQDEAVTLELPVPGSETQVRRLNIYGSPWTPEFGNWAFQYPAIRDVWTDRIPDGIDVLVVHGPPALYGDNDSGDIRTGQVKGDGYLLREIRRVKPKMVVCGHIHGAFGFTVMKYDGAQAILDRLQMRWGGHDLFNALKQTLSGRIARSKNVNRETLVVNAAIAPGVGKGERKSAIAVNFH